MDGRRHNLSPTLVTFAALVLLTTAGGAQCLPQRQQFTSIAGPRVLSESPQQADIIQAVNANSALIRSLYTTDATMSVPGAPSLRANLALEREKKLRLRAETALTGAEVDMGSNDELFWFWVRRNPPPTLYYCRHDKFATSSARQIVPVDPQWLLDAVGLATFDPYHQHSPPTRTPNNNWEIRTTFNGPTGQMSKSTVVDASRGFILEQHLFDARGTLMASALASKHWRDPASGAIVPQQVKINWPATQFSLEFDVKSWQVNNIPADPTALFTLPSFPGWAVVDLGTQTPQPGQTSMLPSISTPQPGTARSGADLIGFAPQYAPTAPANPAAPVYAVPGNGVAPSLQPAAGVRRY
jgi:hypothetical protein